MTDILDSTEVVYNKGFRRWILLLLILTSFMLALWNYSHQEEIVMTNKELLSKIWAGVPAAVEEDKNGIIFRYRSNNRTGLPLKLPDFYKKHFGWPPRSYISLKDNSHLLPDYMFVTAVTNDHFREMLDMLSTVQNYSPKTKVIVFDLGWKDPAYVAKIKHLCNIEYRRFNYSAYPVHVKRAKNYAFKPLVVAEVLKDHPCVLWIDASIRFSHNNILSHIRPQLLGTGGVLGFIGTMHSIYAATNPFLYKYIPPNMEKIRRTEMGGSGCVLFLNTEKVFKNIVLFWVLCALEKKCTQPTTQLVCHGSKLRKGKYAGCHRFDQSVLSLLMGNMLDYNYKLYKDNMEDIGVHRAAGRKNPKLKVCS